MGKRPRAVRLGHSGRASWPILTFVALVARRRCRAVPASGNERTNPSRSLPLTQIAEVLADNSIGRRASLERVVDSRRGQPAHAVDSAPTTSAVFAVLDPDVKNASHVPLRAGARVDR